MRFGKNSKVKGQRSDSLIERTHKELDLPDVESVKKFDRSKIILYILRINNVKKLLFFEDFYGRCV